MNTTQRVEQILKHSTKARNSDKALWIIYAQKSGVGLTPEQVAKIMDMPSFETIRRIRQKIQEVGQYRAEAAVEKERLHKAMIIEQTSPISKPEQLGQAVQQRAIPWNY